MTPLRSLVLHPLAQTLGWTLLHFLWQGVVLGLVAWLTLVLMRGATAKARYGLACAFLVLMVAAPVITFLSLQTQTPTAISDLTLKVEPAASATAVAPIHRNLAQLVKTRLDASLPWLLMGWATGVLMLSARFLGGWIRMQRLRWRNAIPVPAEWHLVLSRLCRELKLSRTVRLLQSAAVEVPTALGWLRPVILLPACALSGLAPAQLEAILAHELAHIRRGDFLVNLLQSLVEVLLFYHPAIWWLSGRIRAERELCCDDVAAALCGDPLILARALTDLEALREPIHRSTPPLALAANGGSLMHRVRHLLHPALPITSGARATALAVLAASLLGAAGVALQDKAKDALPRPDRTLKNETADDKRQVEIRIKGEVKLDGDAANPVTVPGDGSFRVEEKKGGKTRAFSATKDKSIYTVDGQEQPIDQEGKDWLRGVVKQAKRDRALRHGERVVELHSRHLGDREAELDARECELDDKMKDLERRAHGMTAEERANLKAEADHLKAEGAKLKAEGERWKVEHKRLMNDPKLKALMAEAEHEGRKVRVEVIKEKGEVPGTLVIQEDGDSKQVIVKRLKVKQGRGHEAEEDMVIEGMDPDIHIPEIRIPRIHVRAFAHPGEDDPQMEMAELQAELKALQARLDQLQKQMAMTPKPPRPPKAPAAPRSIHPVPPPPPVPEVPPAPAEAPEPPAPPAPPSTPGT